MNEFLEQIGRAAWRTSSARYNAARRLKRRELFGTASIALFSALTVVVAFAQRVFLVPTGSALDNYLTAASMALGILVIVVSLMEWGCANGAKAELLYRNAEDLNAFQRRVQGRLAEFKSGEAVRGSDAEQFRAAYEDLKNRCPFNHIPLDDSAFRASRRTAPEFADSNGKPTIGPARAYWIRALWILHSVWYFSVAWILVGCAAWGAFFFVA